MPKVRGTRKTGKARAPTRGTSPSCTAMLPRRSSPHARSRRRFPGQVCRVGGRAPGGGATPPNTANQHPDPWRHLGLTRTIRPCDQPIPPVPTTLRPSPRGSASRTSTSSGAARTRFQTGIADPLWVRPNRTSTSPCAHRDLRTLATEDRKSLALALERALDVGALTCWCFSEASALLALAAIRGDLLYCADSVGQAEYESFVLRRAGDLAPLERDRQEIVFQGGR